MLKLLYDIRCGFKKVFVTELDAKFELGPLIDDWLADCEDELEFKSQEEYYQLYKDNSKQFQTDLDESGVLDCIESMVMEEFAHSYFKEICFKDKKHPFYPNFCELYNLRLVYEPSEASEDLSSKYDKGFLKAADVMAILNISRPTLCQYVKSGKILVDKSYSGKQYRYDSDSVYRLKDSWKKKAKLRNELREYE